MNIFITDRHRYQMILREITPAAISLIDFLAIKEDNGEYTIVKDRTGKLRGSHLDGEFRVTFEKKITIIETTVVASDDVYS